MAEQQPEDYSKLPLEEKLGHKVWRARLLGYEEAAKVFRRIDDEASPEYSKFTGLIKKFVIDSNQFAQEKGVEAALAFVECASAASKICADVIPGVVTKCLNARPKTKEAGILLCLMFVEIEQYAIVQEEIMKGFSNKQPKIVAGSVQVLSRMVQEFGAKVINLKVLMKAVPALFGHSDKNVRAEAKTLIIELYKWFSTAIKPSLEKNLKPVQMKELEEEWSKLPGSPPAPARLLRSAQQAAASAVPEVSGGVDEDESEEGGAVGGAVVMENIDPYDLADPVDLLAKMAKDFYEKVADPKWKDRKEALENLLPLAQSMKLEPGDYGELMKALKKVITKDSNVLVVALAGNIVTGLAKGLRKGFQSYASFTLAGIFEKFKEKKLNVVNSLRDAADAVYLTTTLGGFQEEAVESLNSKNPSVKSETLLFLCRCFQQCTPAMVPKPLLKALCPLIVQKLDDTNPQVREAAQEALGTLLRVVGDRPLNAYIEGIDKTKMTKIQEHREAVELKIQTGVIHSPMKGQAATTTPAPEKSKPPPKKTPTAATAEVGGDDGDEVKEKPKKKKPVLSTQKNPPKRRKADGESKSSSEATPVAEKKSEPTSAPPSKKKAATGGGGGAKGKGKGKGKGGAAPVKMAPDEKTEPAIAAEEVEDKATAVLPSGLMDRMADPKWKERLEACEKFKEIVEGLPADEIQSLLFCKVLARKPGWKDSNFQVMKAKFDVVGVLIRKATLFGKKSTACVIPPLVEKFADIKVKGRGAETLMVLAERMTLNYVSMQVMKHSFEQKSPKVHSESLDWLGNAIKEFGFIIEIKSQIDFIKKAFTATNPTVRTAAINLLGVIYMYLGAQLRMFFESEKPALLQQIDAAFEKVSGESPPAPTRGPNAKTGDESENDDEEGGEEEEGGASQAPVSLADLMPKVDISGQIKSELIKELGDKNWKIRGEGLQKVQDIIKAAKFIQPSLGDLPGALKGRLGDSNKNLIITTLNIVASLATSMGSGCSKYAKAFIPGTLSALADSKPQVRVAATASLNAWFDELTLVPLVEQEFLSTALATENPNLRVELLGWIEEKLPVAGKLPSELNAIVPPLLSCLEDRSGEVRKKAQVLVPLVMAKVGYDFMAKQAGKLKPASIQAVVAILEKHKSSAPPPKSANKAKQPPAETPTETVTPSSSTGEKKTKKSAKAGEKTKDASGTESSGRKTTGKGTSTKKGKGGQQAASSESSGAALVFVPNGKESRTKDEEKMKTLKWNFNQPRSEHINQLKEQLQPCVSAALFSQLFHDDFKQHIAALATLTKGVSGDTPLKDAAIGCTDLLLRWITLRFFDTNTTVNLKCLEFLNALFKMLINDGDYRMSDYEANAFLPYLVNKVGDPKEPVRKGVRSLFRELCSFYPPSKLFSFVIEGLKSKNARQRMECLEELGVLIQNNGMVVCGAQPQKTMPLIASQISDRDNAVRSAALNAMVVVYGNVGESMYKFSSQLSEKDVSILEERIRRSGSKPPQAATTEPSTSTKEETKAESVKKGAKQSAATKSQPPTGDKSITVPSTTTESPQLEGTTENEPSAEPLAPPKPLHVPGPFKIDFDKYKVAPLKKPPFTSLTLTPDEMSLIFGPNPEIPKFEFKSMKPPSSLSPSRMASTSAAVNFIISQITSTDGAASCKALKQLESVMTSPSQRVTMKPHVDQLIRSILMQMKMNFSAPLTNASDPQALQEVMEMGKALISCLVVLFTESSLAVLVSQETLTEVEGDVMTYLVDSRLLKLEEAAQLIRSINYFMLRVCENADKTALYGSLLQVLLQSLNPDGSTTKLTELTLKCIWKTTRQLSQLIPSIKVDQLLKSLHLFLKAYHAMVPAPRADNMVYRTVRTVTFVLTDTLGEKILDHFSLIKDHKHTKLYQSIQKTLAKRRLSLEKETRTSASKISSAGIKGHTEEKKGLMQASLKAVACLPPGASHELSEILKRIPQPSTAKEGLRELYHFKQRYPEFDLNEFMKDNSKIYQSYVQRGLKSVEAEMMGQGDSSFDPSQFTTEEYQKHRRELEEIKLRASQVLNIQFDEGKSSSGKRLEGSFAKKENKPTGNTSQANLTSSGSTSATKSGLDLKDLRRRLDMLKGTSH